MAFLGVSATNTSVTTYDRLGRAILQQIQKAPSSSNYDTVAISYDGRGRPRYQTLPYQGTLSQYVLTGPGVTTSYDAVDRLTQTLDGGGGSVSYSYFGNDALVAVGPAPTGENLKQRQLEYNGAGWLTSVCELTSTSITPGGGSCVQTTNPTGYLTKYAYNAAGWLKTVQQNAQAGSTGMQTRTVTYDGLGRKLTESIPEWSAGTGSPGSSSYTYDSDSSGTCTGTYTGDLLKKVDNLGNVTCFTYDKLHRALTTKVVSGTYAFPTTADSYFVYDAATYNSTAMQNAKGALAEAYTCTTTSCTTKITDEFFSASPVTTGAAAGGVSAQMWQSTQHSSGYFLTQDTFFPNGVISNISALLGSSTFGIPNITYNVDGEGRAYSTRDVTNNLNVLASVSYNPASQPTTMTFGNAATGSAADVDTFWFDNNTDRPTQVKSAINPTTGAFTLTNALTWNANGSLKQTVLTDTNDTSKNQTCTYSADDLSRISSASCGGAWAQTFTYDPFGNITKAGSITYAASYSTATNQVSGGVPFSYDANGNQLSSTPATLTWNAQNEPISVNSTTAIYDALGRMVETASGSTYTQFVFRPSGNMLAVYRGGLVKGLIPLAGEGTAIYNAGGLSYIRHQDWLGSSRLATTWAHAVYSKTAYAPFGETYNEALTPDRSFTGQDQDVQTGSGGNGVYDFLFRKYDPSAGRWMSPDPYAWGAVSPDSPQSLNRYAYALNQPMTLTDPLGWDECESQDSAGGDTCMSVGGPDFEDYGDDGDGVYGYGNPVLFPGSERGQHQSSNPCDGPSDTSTQCLLYLQQLNLNWQPGVSLGSAPYSIQSSGTANNSGKPPGPVQKYISFLGCEVNDTVETSADQDPMSKFILINGVFQARWAYKFIMVGLQVKNMNLVSMALAAGYLDYLALHANAACTKEIYGSN
jgi:RHS repeat-associated protein